jgi:hypothetical protein
MTPPAHQSAVGRYFRLRLYPINTSEKETLIFSGSLRNHSYSPEMTNILNCKQLIIKQERETVTYIKFTYTEKETKFITEPFKQTKVKVTFQTNNLVEKLSRNTNLIWQGI